MYEKSTHGDVYFISCWRFELVGACSFWLGNRKFVWWTNGNCFKDHLCFSWSLCNKRGHYPQRHLQDVQ